MASERILLVQLADIGDLVLSTPAIAALREAKPNAHIELLATAQALPLLPEGLLDDALPFARQGESASRAFFRAANLRLLAKIWHRHYDALVFFHHFTLRAGRVKFWLIARASGARRILGLQHGGVDFLTDGIADEGFGAKHQAQYWLELVALLGADARARRAQVKREACLDPDFAAASASGKPLVVMHGGSGGYSRARRWHPARFAAVARALRSRRGAEIILVGERQDRREFAEAWRGIDALNLLGKTTLPQLAAVLKRADLFIGADSGVMHIAAAVGTPVIGIFGPSNAAAWQPWTPGGRSIVLRSGVACSPCSYVGHGIGARGGCAARTCMKLISAEKVLAAADSLLGGGAASSAHDLMPPVVAAAETAAEHINILGLAVAAITYEGWLARIESWIAQKARAQQVCTINPEFIMIARRDPIFWHILRRAALCVPDGVGLLWASRQLGAPLPQRVTGSDGVPIIAERAAQRGWRIFFLGAAEGIAQRAADTLQRRYPALLVAGVYAGSPAEAEEDAIVAMVNTSGADILFVAYGAPRQDKWIARNLPRLQVRMAMGVGGSLDFIAGAVPRAPRWMQARGLEWLFRLLRQPWRARRMLRLPRFVAAVLWQRAAAAKSATRMQGRQELN